MTCEVCNELTGLVIVFPPTLSPSGGVDARSRRMAVFQRGGEEPPQPPQPYAHIDIHVSAAVVAATISAAVAAAAAAANEGRHGSTPVLRHSRRRDGVRFFFEWWIRPLIPITDGTRESVTVMSGPCPVDFMTLMAAVFLASFYGFHLTVLATHASLAVSLAYLVSASALLGAVQLAFPLARVGFSRTTQLLVLWLWTLTVCLGPGLVLLMHAKQNAMEDDPVKMAISTSVFAVVVGAASPVFIVSLVWCLAEVLSCVVR